MTPADDTKPSADGSPDFEQLSLDATITGPGMRTEDPFEPGTKLKIKGERGSFEYRYASLSRAGLVSLHLVGDRGSRAVRPDQVILVRRSRRHSGKVAAAVPIGDARLPDRLEDVLDVTDSTL